MRDDLAEISQPNSGASQRTPVAHAQPDEGVSSQCSSPGPSLVPERSLLREGPGENSITRVVVYQLKPKALQKETPCRFGARSSRENFLGSWERLA